jgi:hypothetical protein
MAEVLAEYPDVLTDDNHVAYRAHVCGGAMADGLWQGWIEFIPLDGASAIRSGRETTQPNRKDAAYWATGLTTVYLQGALRRALNPLVRPTHEPDIPVFDEPAPPAVELPSTPAAAAHDAVMNPFAIYERGEAALRRQLAAVQAWHLVNIIRAYRLSDESGAALNRLPAAALIEIIVTGVAGDRRDSA